MWVTEHQRSASGNDLYRLAAVTGLLLALFLFAGASGHFTATWPAMNATDPGNDVSRWALLLPGMVLAGSCIANGLLAPGLWLRNIRASQVALAVNSGCLAYLAYLLAKGVPGHPIGIFLTLVCSHWLILLVTVAGLVWPSPLLRKEP